MFFCFFLVGPQFGFIIDDKDFDDSIKSFDFGVGAGLSYNIINGLSAEIRYNLGLINIADESGVDLKQNNFQIGVGYSF